MITNIHGDLLDSNAKYIAHQCNCISTRSAYLAADIFKKYPYADTYSARVDQNIPGTISIHGNGKNERYVINMYAQIYPGAPKFPDSAKDGLKARRVHFFNCLLKIAKIENLESIAFPFHIGCGVAGGDWELYLGLINKFANYLGDKTKIYIMNNNKD